MKVEDFNFYADDLEMILLKEKVEKKLKVWIGREFNYHWVITSPEGYHIMWKIKDIIEDRELVKKILTEALKEKSTKVFDKYLEKKVLAKDVLI